MKMNDIVYAANGEFAMTKLDYLDMICREMKNWWMDATKDEREEYGTFLGFVNREKNNWINEDQDFTTYACWLESHEEH